MVGNMNPQALLRFPSAVRRDPAVEVWLTRQNDERYALARRWFARMKSCGGDVTELMHDGCPTVCVGDAAFAYVGVYTAHVNVGFFLGAMLDDPSGCLEGVGKRMRHVKLKPGVPVNEPALETLIDSAYRDIKRRIDSGWE
jgi:hypothetical protein